MSALIVFCLPDGRWLALEQATFEAALIAGRAFSGAPTVPASLNEPLLDAEHAAPRLGMTERWLVDGARAGIVPHVKLGRYMRFRVSEVADHFHVKGATPETLRGKRR